MTSDKTKKTRPRRGQGDQTAAEEDQWAAERPDLPLDGFAILARVRRIARLADRRTAEVLRAHELDVGELEVLGALRRVGPPFTLRPTELFRSLMVTSSGLTSRLSRLEDRKLIARPPSSTDRRSTPVKLSAKGRRLIDDAIADRMRAEEALLASLDDADKRALRQRLGKLARALETDAE